MDNSHPMSSRAAAIANRSNGQLQRFSTRNHPSLPVSSHHPNNRTVRLPIPTFFGILQWFTRCKLDECREVSSRWANEIHRSTPFYRGNRIVDHELDREDDAQRVCRTRLHQRHTLKRMEIQAVSLSLNLNLCFFWSILYLVNDLWIWNVLAAIRIPQLWRLLDKCWGNLLEVEEFLSNFYIFIKMSFSLLHSHFSDSTYFPNFLQKFMFRSKCMMAITTAPLPSAFVYSTDYRKSTLLKICCDSFFASTTVLCWIWLTLLTVKIHHPAPDSSTQISSTH